jgi:hypothetical protein
MLAGRQPIFVIVVAGRLARIKHRARQRPNRGAIAKAPVAAKEAVVVAASLTSAEESPASTDFITRCFGSAMSGISTNETELG